MPSRISLHPTLTEFEDRFRAGTIRGLELCGALLRETAAGYIGQELDDWPDLAPSTVADKRAHGYGGQISDTDPLLRTGKLRSSIRWSLDSDTLTLRVGSSDPVAILQELGTSTIPPRPFLARAAEEKEAEMVEIIKREIMAALLSR